MKLIVLSDPRYPKYAYGVENLKDERRIIWVVRLEEPFLMGCSIDPTDESLHMLLWPPEINEEQEVIGEFASLFGKKGDVIEELPDEVTYSFVEERDLPKYLALRDCAHSGETFTKNDWEGILRIVEPLSLWDFNREIGGIAPVAWFALREPEDRTIIARCADEIAEFYRAFASSHSDPS
jgi:hypothetical protein